MAVSRLFLLVACLIGTAVGSGALATVTFGNHTDNMFMTANDQTACYDQAWASSRFCRTDNANYSVYRESTLSATGKSNIAYTLNNSYNTTDLAVSYPSSPQYSGDTETDVIYQAVPSSVPDGYEGWTWCNDAVSIYVCDQHYVAFEISSPRVALACHETGHSVGLTHGNRASPAVSQTDAGIACMTQPIQTYLLGSHNAGQINGTY